MDYGSSLGRDDDWFVQQQLIVQHGGPAYIRRARQVQEEFDLSVNEAAAERMGVTIPDSVLERAVTNY